jgi:alginate O-acetyltransferase complex protein AlgI
MIFNSIEFLFFFLPITYLVFWMLKTANARYVWLTITGYIFYGWWDARFCLLIGFSTLVSFLAGLGFLRWQEGWQRRLCLIVPIVMDLLLLGFFKYANFLLDLASSLQGLFGSKGHGLHLDIILPVGISFYTFHTISYIVDCYRRVVRPTRNLFEFAAYVSLFSQLVAGPIVRFSQLEKDLENIAVADRATLIPWGISFFLTGLIEKVVIADSIAFLIDPHIEKIGSMSTLASWELLIGYSMQLYFDFSGYSTMAIGLGLLFGMHIPQNFNSPYKAASLGDFWRRWHISLSNCMRDYLYIPLGGNRLGIRRNYVNLFLTMLIGGIWHGANWTFVLWGAWHGLWLCLFKKMELSKVALGHWGGRIVTLLVVMFGWVLFRAPDMEHAMVWYRQLLIPTVGASVPKEGILLVLLVIAWYLAAVARNPVELHDEQKGWVYPPWAACAIFGAVLALIVGWGNSPFLYFQF